MSLNFTRMSTKNVIKHVLVTYNPKHFTHQWLQKSMALSEGNRQVLDNNSDVKYRYMLFWLFPNPLVFKLHIPHRFATPKKPYSILHWLPACKSTRIMAQHASSYYAASPQP